MAIVKSQVFAQRRCHALLCLATGTVIAMLLAGLPTASAQNGSEGKNCLSDADMQNSTGLVNLDIHVWSRRGDCVRENGSELQCLSNLQVTLSLLNTLRAAEYSAAAGVLSLLPTIGALLGAPTNEIWKLMNIVPFGGGIAMALSFGGAILPGKVEDYEDAVDRRDMAIGSIVSQARYVVPGEGPLFSTEDKLALLIERIRQRLDKRESSRILKRHLWTGIIVMLLFFAAAQGAMGAVEQGGVVAFWCSWRWWMHFWYIFVTLIAVCENWVQTPFSKTHKLYLSTVPYEITTVGGEPMTKHFEGEATDNVAIALRQLGTLKVARTVFHGSQQKTRARNSVMIMVSVVGVSPWKKYLRVLSRSFSIAFFVIGTAIFASVTLLSLKMAVMVITLNLGAGVMGRATASSLVSHVSDIEPMIHLMVNSPEQAHMAIAEILALKGDDGNLFQTEIRGHVFINGRRVGKRSSLWVSILGVMAEPYDLRKTQDRKQLPTDAEFPFLEKYWSPTSMTGQEKSAQVHVHDSGVRDSDPDFESSSAGDSGVIPRKPVATHKGYYSPVALR